MPPLYDYACTTCSGHVEEFRSVANRNDAPKCQCGGQTQKVFSVAKPIGDVQPYYDDNLETHIRSKQHRKQVMKEKGLGEIFGKGWY